jgi:hypothetical protein
MAVFHLPVIDLALTALRSSSDKMKVDLLAALDAVIRVDRRVSLHEFVVLTLLRTQLAKPTRPRASKYRTVADARDDVLRLMALVAYSGQITAKGSRSEIATAFAKGAIEIGLKDAVVPEVGAFKFNDVSRALDNLRDLAPLAKGELIKGLFAVITADGKIRVAEAELMRLVGAVLDCPLPLLFESIDPPAEAV